MSFDNYIHATELVLGLLCSPFAWKLNRAVNKYLDERENYPPHRHIRNGDILYPKGLKPNGIDRVVGD